MGNKAIFKIPVNKKRFMEVLKYRKTSIRKLGEAYNEIGRTEKTIRVCLDSGEMSPDLLDNIAKYLNIHPDYISGIYDQQAEKIEDDYLRMLFLKQIRPENYPYLLKEKNDILTPQAYNKFFKDILIMSNISLSQFNNLSVDKRIIFREEILVAILSVVNKYFSVNSLGNSIANELSYAESMVGDMDNYLAKLEGIVMDEPDFEV